MQASEKKGDQVHFPPKGTGARYELPEHTQTSFEVLELIDNYVKTFGPRVGKGTAVRETQLVKTWSLLVLVEHYRKSMASPPSLTGLGDETILSLLTTRIQETKGQGQCLAACEHLQKLGSQRWKRLVLSLFNATVFFYVSRTRTKDKRSFLVQRTGTAVPSMKEEEGRGFQDTRAVYRHVIREFASIFRVPRQTGQTGVPTVSVPSRVHKTHKTHKNHKKQQVPKPKKKVEKKKTKKAVVSSSVVSNRGSSDIQVSTAVSSAAAPTAPTAPTALMAPIVSAASSLSFPNLPFPASSPLISVPVIPFSSQTAHLFSHPPSSPFSPFFPLFVAACRSTPSLSSPSPPSPPPSGK